MARSFEPDAAAGFQGDVVYELARPATGAEPTRWTIEVTDGHASARSGGVSDPAPTVPHTPLRKTWRQRKALVPPVSVTWPGDFL